MEMNQNLFNIVIRKIIVLPHELVKYSNICFKCLIKIHLFITLHSLKIMESFNNRFTSQVDFNPQSMSWTNTKSIDCPIKTNDIFFLVLHLITELNILQLFKLKLCSYILLQFKIQLTLKLILLLDLTLI
jgi:hypothetical protein